MFTGRTVPISHVEIHENEIAAVVEVLRSGNLRQGSQVSAFEEEFAEEVGAAHALAVNSGTAALHMAYAALLQPGDEVLVPSFTYYATASMVMAVGAVPVFCDVDPHTFTLDVADAERRITERTRAIAPVHLFGNPVDVSAVRALAHRYGLATIWDAAQAHLSAYAGRDVGSLGEAVCYSFYPSKNMTTGEGGMVTTDSAALVKRMALIRSQGESEKYLHPVLGYNFRMTDIQAAIGRGQLRHLRGWTEQRRENAAYLRMRLSPSPHLSVQAEQPEGYHSYHQFSVVLANGIDRDGLVAGLHEAGIGCAVHYPVPLHRQPVFAPYGAGAALPRSEKLARHILSVPVHPHLSPDDLAYVANTVLEQVDAIAA